MAIKKFDSQQWLAEHGYESSYSGSSSKATSTTSTGLKIFDSNQWLSDHGYVKPTFTDYSYAPKIDYLQELQNNENEIQTLKTGFGYEIPDTTDGLGFWEGVKSIGQYIQGKWNTGFGAVIGALGEAPDMASKAFNNLYGTAVVNPIRKVLGLEAINTNISTRELLRNASTEALGYLGLKPVEINTENIQNKAVKQFLDDAQSGKNPFAEHYYRLSQQYNDYSAPILTELEKVKTGWGKVTSATAKYGGMIAESQPQSLLYAIPQAGAILGTTSTYSRNLRESYQREDLTGLQQTTMGMELAAVDAYSELVFGLFGEAAALFKGATASAIEGAVKPTVGKLIASVFLTGAEESLEEMIAYPFQKYVEWRYSNGGKPVEQYSSYLNAKEFGESALVGFLSGALFAGGQIAIDKVNQNITKPIVDLGADLASTPVDELSKPENIAKVESYVNAVADAQINNPEIFTVKSEFEMPSVTPDTIGTQPIAQPVVETDNVGIHFGDLGKAEPMSQMLGGSRGTGHFGTGTYFISGKNESYQRMLKTQYGQRPKQTVSFDNYNLFKPQNYNDGIKFHDSLKFINNKLFYNFDLISNENIETEQSISNSLYEWEETITDDNKLGDEQKLNELENKLNGLVYKDDLEFARKADVPWRNYEDLAKQSYKKLNRIDSYKEQYKETILPTLSKQLNIDENRLNSILSKLIVSNRDVTEDYQKAKTTDSISTMLMKELGYEGVDVRHIERLDNEEFGSVIYDLKKQTAQKPIKTTPQIAEQLEQMAEKEPSGNVNSFIPESVRSILSDVQASITTDTKYTGVFDEDVKKRIDESMVISHPKSINERLTQLKSFLTSSFLRGSVDLPFKFGELRQLIRQYRQANAAADTQVENFILRTYEPIGKNNFTVMRDSVLFLDLAEDIANGLYDDGKPLPFGIKNKSDALKMSLDVIEKVKTNPIIQDAINRRRQIMNTMRDQLVNTAKTIGYDLSYLQNRSEYMHHAILEYIDEQSKEKHKRTGKPSGYKERYGSYKDYVSDPALSDYLVMRKMLKDMMRFNIYNELKTMDIKDLTPVDADGAYIIPDGYAEFDRHLMGLNYIDSITADAEFVPEFIASVKEQLGIESDEIVEKIRQQTVKMRNNQVLIIPVEVKNAIVKEFELKTSDAYPNFQKKLTQVWKRWQLESPRRFIKYNVKNFAGDTDAMLMIYPQSVKKIARSFKELNDFYRHGKMTKELSSYSWLGGLSSSLSTVELGDLQSLPHFTFYENEQNIGKLAVNKFRKLTRGIQNFTEWREQLLRYASFLQLKEELSKSPNGLPKDYGASIPTEIKSIKSIDGRAYKLSNDALGAYNDVTPMAQGMSKTIYPFFRFKEVNMKRFFRLAKNIFYNDPSIVQSAGQDAVNKFAKGVKTSAYATMKIGKIALGYGAFNLALALWNSVVAPDEEDELPEDIKNKPHIVFPRWATGGEIFYYSDLSSFYQLFSDIGFDGIGDVYSDLKEIINGKMTLGDKVVEIATETASNFMSGMAPFYRPAMEAIVGKSIYPDISKPSTVRDPWEHLFKSIGLEYEYRVVAGKPLPNGSYIESFKKAFAYTVVPGEAAMWDVYDMKDRYYESINKKVSSGFLKDDKAMAIYNYKLALKANDTKAAERYLKEYAIRGGTKATYKKSMDALDPTYGMSSADKKKFLDGMSEDEKTIYNRAVEYYKSLQEMGEPTGLPLK